MNFLKRILGPLKAVTMDRKDFMDLIEALHENEDEEERLCERLKVCPPIEVRLQVEAILRVREERVTIMHRLGWYDAATRLSDNTAMRRVWVNEERTPWL